ncbi:MAG: hypothetical protein JSW34_01460 [Candidatus Zixiibacteriota bacterium]|nr:MAG: hypothetical protein JSW34_01460 [candidate division Zixibacteria bacterium]
MRRILTCLMVVSAAALIGTGCSRDSSTGPDDFANGRATAVQQSLVTGIDYFDVGYPYVAWQDGFETYTVGTWPPTFKADGNAPVPPNGIVNDVFYEGAQSLRLYGVVGGCWAGCAYRALTVSPPYEVKVAVYNGNEPLSSSCQPARGHVGILAGTNWWDPWRTFVYFNRYGEIISSGGEVLGTYNSLEWYLLRIRYERIDEGNVRLRYWVNNRYILSETLPVRTEEDNMVTLTFEALEGSAWFDAAEVRDRH